MTSLSRLLKESWALVEDRADTVAGYFYARMFLTHPPLRELFPLQMDEQRKHLLNAIVRVVQTVDDPERFATYLRGLGRDHRKFHVRPAHYAIVGDCLIEALREHSRGGWTAEYDQAWRDAYRAIAAKMMDGAEADADSPPCWHAEVVDHERRARDIAVFTVRPWPELPFRAGQYVTVETPHRPRLWRPYSIANAPRADGTLEFHVRATRNGWVSSALVRKLAVGDVVRLGPALGSMTLDRRSPRDIVCIAGGTGLAPIKALVDELTRFNRNRWTYVFHGARTVDDLYDLPALREYADSYPWLNVVPAVSDDDLPDDAERGLISDVMAKRGPWQEHDVYVCGPPDMVRATRRRLDELEVPPMRIHHDTTSDL